MTSRAVYLRIVLQEMESPHDLVGIKMHFAYELLHKCTAGHAETFIALMKSSTKPPYLLLKCEQVLA